MPSFLLLFFSVILNFHPTTYISQELSSHDRSGGNADGGPAWLYEENGWKIVFEAFGEGRVTRFWTTDTRHNIPFWGDISVEIDGREVVRGRLYDLFTGRLSLSSENYRVIYGTEVPTRNGSAFNLQWPLVADDMQSSGGYLSLIPWPFHRHARIKISGQPHYYQFSYQTGQGSSAGPTAEELRQVFNESWHENLPPCETPAVQTPSQETPYQIVAHGPRLITMLALRGVDVTRSTIQMVRRGSVVLSAPIDLFFGSETFNSPQLDTFHSLAFAADTASRTVMTRMPLPIHEDEELRVLGPPVQICQFNTNLPPRTPRLEVQVREITTPGPQMRSTMTLFETSRPAVLMHTVVAAQGHTRRWLEGDEMIRTDDMAFPLQIGTGTEDYFNGGWYFYSAFANPTSGLSHFEAQWRQDDFKNSMYRHHLVDPIVGRTGIRFGLEAGDEGDFSGALYRTLGWGYVWDSFPAYQRLTLNRQPTIRTIRQVPPQQYTVQSSYDGERSLPTSSKTFRTYQGVSRITMTAPRAATNLMVIRNLDAAQCPQVAAVHLLHDLTSSPTYTWGFTHCNQARRFAQDVIVIPIPSWMQGENIIFSVDSSASPVPWTEENYQFSWF